jgi:transposase
VSRIHKVLHCKTSVIGLRRTKTTWNRDVNAAHNILMLLMTELHGYD